MILGLTGLAGCGKDTAAAHFVARHGYERRAFADPMRDALYRLNPIVRLHGHDRRLAQLVDLAGWDAAKRQVPEVRALLQRFGTEVGRAMWGEDFWVERATAGACPGDRLVFTDVRFDNEAAAIRALGGRVIRIDRPGAGLEGTTATHASEQGVEADFTILNSGDDLAAFYWQVENVLLLFAVPAATDTERVVA